MKAMALETKFLHFPIGLGKTTEIAPKACLNFCHVFSVLKSHDKQTGSTPNKQNEHRYGCVSFCLSS